MASQIVMSVVVHGHVLLTQQWLAVGVVFSGLALEVVDSELEKRRKHAGIKQDPSDVAPRTTSAAQDFVAVDLPVPSVVSGDVSALGAVSRM